MENISNKFDDFVTKSILAKNKFRIIRVEDLASLKSFVFDQSLYQDVVNLVRRDELAQINALMDDEHGDQFLEVMKFQDQNGYSYVATVFDSLELSQDPQIIEIFRLAPGSL